MTRPKKQKRRHISSNEKLAAALLALGDIPYVDAKKMTADQIISLYHFDHGILHAVNPINEFWNLTPRLIAAHRTKSRRDTSTVAKVKRLDTKWAAFMSAVSKGRKPKKQNKKWRWPKRNFVWKGE